MRETRSIKTSSEKNNRIKRTATVLFRSVYYDLSGEFQWDLSGDHIFCSDVILSLAPETDGLRGLIHPDDISNIKILKEADGKEIRSIYFRIISTNGNVYAIEGNDIEIISQKDASEELSALIEKNTSDQKELLNLRLIHDIYTSTEKITDSGIWFYNASTHETWYSDHVFHIHGMPAQSLNSHLQTFRPFIHPDEIEPVNEFIARAYKKRVPLQIDYRITTPKGEKTVRYMSDWRFNEKGEAILAGSFQDITEKTNGAKKMEDAEALAHFQSQLLHFDEQQATLGHWQVNLLTRKISFTDNFFRLFGLRPQQLTSGLKSLANYLHPDDRDEFLRSIKNMFNEHKVPDMSFRLLKPDGKTRYMQLNGKLLSLGSELVMSCTIRDITLVKGMEKKITDLEQDLFLKNFLRNESENTKGGGSWIVNLKTGEIDWSDRMYAFAGLKPDSVSFFRKKLLLLVHPDDKKIFTEKLNHSLAEKNNIEFNFRAVYKGETKYMKAVFRFIKFRETEFFAGMLQNINRETTLHNELLQRMQLSESISENILDGVIITDIHNNILLWNKNCETIYGIKKDQALGRNFFDLFPNLKTEQVLSHFDRVLKGESITLNDQTSANQKGYFDIQMIPLWSSEEPEATGIIRIIHETTKEFQLRQRLNERLSFIESMVDSSVDRIIVLDRNMCYMVWNKKCELAYGLKKEDVIGKNVLEVFPGWQDEIAFTHFRKALKGETIHLPPAHEKGRDYEVYLIPVKTGQDQISAVLWVMHDYHLETELAIQKVKNIQLLNSLDEDYMEIDRDYRIVFMNTSAEEFFNIKKENVTGRILWDAFPQLANTRIKDAIITSMEDILPVRGEFISPTKGITVFASFTPTPDGLSLLFIDIEEEKQNERKLKEREHLISQVTNSTPDAITIYDLETKQPDYLNDRLASWLGFTNEELFGLGVEGRKKLFPEEDWKKMTEFNARLNGAKDGDILTIEYCLFTRTGEKIRILNRSKVFRRDENGKVKQMISILQRV